MGANSYRIVYRPLTGAEIGPQEAPADPNAPDAMSSPNLTSEPRKPGKRDTARHAATPGIDAASHTATPCGKPASDTASHAASVAAWGVQPLRHPMPQEQTLNRLSNHPTAEAAAVRACERDGSARPARAKTGPAILCPMQSPPPADPLGDVVRWIAGVTHEQEGNLWARAVGWHSNLGDAGYSDADAQAAIVGEAVVLRTSGDTRRLCERLDELVTARVRAGPGCGLAFPRTTRGGGLLVPVAARTVGERRITTGTSAATSTASATIRAIARTVASADGTSTASATIRYTARTVASTSEDDGLEIPKFLRRSSKGPSHQWSPGTLQSAPVLKATPVSGLSRRE